MTQQEVFKLTDNMRTLVGAWLISTQRKYVLSPMERLLCSALTDLLITKGLTRYQTNAITHCLIDPALLAKLGYDSYDQLACDLWAQITAISQGTYPEPGSTTVWAESVFEQLISLQQEGELPLNFAELLPPSLLAQARSATMQSGFGSPFQIGASLAQHFASIVNGVGRQNGTAALAAFARAAEQLATAFTRSTDLAMQEKLYREAQLMWMICKGALCAIVDDKSQLIGEDSALLEEAISATLTCYTILYDAAEEFGGRSNWLGSDPDGYADRSTPDIVAALRLLIAQQSTSTLKHMR